MKNAWCGPWGYLKGPQSRLWGGEAFGRRWRFSRGLKWETENMIVLWDGVAGGSGLEVWARVMFLSAGLPLHPPSLSCCLTPLPFSLFLSLLSLRVKSLDHEELLRVQNSYELDSILGVTGEPGRRVLNWEIAWLNLIFITWRMDGKLRPEVGVSLSRVKGMLVVSGNWQGC